MRNHVKLAASLTGVVVLAMWAAGAVAAEDQDDPGVLRAENKMLKATMAQRDKEIAALKDQVRSLKAGPEQVEVQKLRGDVQKLRGDVQKLRGEAMEARARVQELTQQLAASKPTTTQPTNTSENKVVLTAREFASLPKGSRSMTPLGFTDVVMDAVGYIHTASVDDVVDESTAVVSFVMTTKDGYILKAYGNAIQQRLIIEGLPTKGLANNAAWGLNRWFKVVATRKHWGTTYFVAHEVVQAGN